VLLARVLRRADRAGTAAGNL